jgi:hypothetical protein
MNPRTLFPLRLTSRIDSALERPKLRLPGWQGPWIGGPGNRWERRPDVGHRGGDEGCGTSSGVSIAGATSAADTRGSLEQELEEQNCRLPEDMSFVDLGIELLDETLASAEEGLGMRKCHRVDRSAHLCQFVALKWSTSRADDDSHNLADEKRGIARRQTREKRSKSLARAQRPRARAAGGL